MGFPTIITEVAFSTDPKVTPVWTDVSTFSQVVSTKRGRQLETDRVEGGSARISFDNSDRRFDNTYTAGPYYPNVKPMRRTRIRATYNAVTYDIFTGYARAWPPVWEKPSWSEVATDVVDGFAAMARAPIGTGSAWPAELSGARINRALDVMNWPTADRVIEAGQTTIEPVTFAVEADSFVLGHCMDVADTELGVFFIDAQGRAVFHDRHHRLKPASIYTPLATYGDGGGSELDWDQIQPVLPEERIINDFRITPSGGSVQRVFDQTSIDRYFHRVQKRTPLMTSAVEAFAHAEYLTARYKEPQLRFDRVVLRPTAIADGALQDSLWVEVLSREIGDRITLKARPPGGGNDIAQDCHIEGIEHQIADQLWETIFYLSPADPLTYWILGDATYGLLGQTTNLAI